MVPNALRVTAGADVRPAAKRGGACLRGRWGLRALIAFLVGLAVLLLAGGSAA